MGIYFVTAATGGQGSAVAWKLKNAGHEVRCLVRDPESAKARALQDAGMILVKGDLNSRGIFPPIVRGCDGIFLNTQPGSNEAEQARNVLEAVKNEGVPVVVAATVTRAEEYEMFTKPTDGFYAYWQGKAAVQRLVAGSGIPSWTILQPAWIMTNFIAPNASMYCPELKDKHTLLGALNPHTKLQLVDPADIGIYAAAALTDAERARWHQQIIRVAGEELTLEEVAHTISSVSRKNIVAEFRPSEEIDELAATNPVVWAERWQRDDGTQVDIPGLQRFNLPLTSFRDFLQRNEGALKAAISTA